MADFRVKPSPEMYSVEATPTFIGKPNYFLDRYLKPILFKLRNGV